MSANLPAHPFETFYEWRVTGDPGEGYPKYDFVWSKEAGPNREDPESGARNFHAMIRAHERGWADGPHLFRRTVTRTAWEPMERSEDAADV